MTTTARTSPAPPAEAGPVRRVLSVAFLGLPALAVVAFGGQLLVTGWLDGRQDGSFHAQDLAWGAAEGILLFVGLVASLRHAHHRPAALQQALAVVVALVVTMTLTLEPDPVTVVLALLVVAGALLSPARSLVARRAAPVSRPLVALALVAAVPLVPYALGAAAAQRRGASLNAELAGYTGATVWAVALLAVVSVAALRSPGWQLPALSAAAAAAVAGVAGLVWPGIPSSVGMLGGLAALAWAAAVLTVVVTTGRRTLEPGQAGVLLADELDERVEVPGGGLSAHQASQHRHRRGVADAAVDHARPRCWAAVASDGMPIAWPAAITVSQSSTPRTVRISAGRASGRPELLGRRPGEPVDGDGAAGEVGELRRRGAGPAGRRRRAAASGVPGRAARSARGDPRPDVGAR